LHHNAVGENDGNLIILTTPTIYYDRSAIIDRTIRNKGPDIVILDKTIKEAYLIDVAIPKSKPSQHRHWEAPEVYRLERKASKNMTAESGLYNTTSTIHNRYDSKTHYTRV